MGEDKARQLGLVVIYFAHDLFAASKQGRIGSFPFDPRHPVQSSWNLGRNDLNLIWLHQHVGGHERFVGYYENSGEFIGHYVSWLREWAEERRASFGTSFRTMVTGSVCGRRAAKGGVLGFHLTIVERPRSTEVAM